MRYIILLLLVGCSTKVLPPVGMDIDATRISQPCAKPALMPKEGLDQLGALTFTMDEAEKLQLCGKRYETLLEVLCAIANCKTKP